MSLFILNLAICSAVMSGVTAGYILLEKALQNVWRARQRSALWAVIAAGFLTPFKPHLPAAVTLDAGTAVTTAEAVKAGRLNVDPFTVLFAVWLGGALLTAARFALRQSRFNAYARRNGAPGSARCRALAAETANALGVKEPKVVYAAGLASPMLTGLFTPTLLLPQRVFTDAELRLIFTHELTHFKRRDLWLQLAFLACRAVHWFNPLMPLFARALDRDRELACDEAVASGESAARKKEYCGVILSAAGAACGKACAPVLSGSLGCSKEQLRARLKLILSADRRKSLTALCVLAAAAVALSGSLLAAVRVNARDTLEETTSAEHTYERSTFRYYERDTAPTAALEQSEPDAGTSVRTDADDYTDRTTTFAAPTSGAYEETAERTTVTMTTYPYPAGDVGGPPPATEPPYGVYETTTVKNAAN